MLWYCPPNQLQQYVGTHRQGLQASVDISQRQQIHLIRQLFHSSDTNRCAHSAVTQTTDGQLPNDDLLTSSLRRNHQHVQAGVQQKLLPIFYVFVSAQLIPPTNHVQKQQRKYIPQHILFLPSALASVRSISALTNRSRALSCFFNVSSDLICSQKYASARCLLDGLTAKPVALPASPTLPGALSWRPPSADSRPSGLQRQVALLDVEAVEAGRHALRDGHRGDGL